MKRGGTRDRRDRGLRGLAYGRPQPGDLAPHGVPANRTRAEDFDHLAVTVMTQLWRRWPDELGAVQLGVEEVPVLPDSWVVDSVPLCTYAEATSTSPAKIVLLRRPIEHRAEGRAELTALLLTVLVDQAAEILGLPPERVHPGYDPED